jgi:hypothetical protein
MAFRVIIFIRISNFDPALLVLLYLFHNPNQLCQLTFFSNNLTLAISCNRFENVRLIFYCFLSARYSVHIRNNLDADQVDGVKHGPSSPFLIFFLLKK